MNFIVYELVYSILAGESFDYFVFMLSYALNEITSHTSVKRAIWFTG